MDPWSIVSSMSVAIFAAVALNIAQFWPTNALLGVIGGPSIWIGFTYANAFTMREGEAWMLRTSQGAALLQVARGKVHSFAAWPPGLGVGDQLLGRVTTEADRYGHALWLRCPRSQVAFYQRHGFRIIRPRHSWSLSLVKMRRRTTPQRHPMPGTPGTDDPTGNLAD